MPPTEVSKYSTDDNRNWWYDMIVMYTKSSIEVEL